MFPTTSNNRHYARGTGLPVNPEVPFDQWMKDAGLAFEVKRANAKFVGINDRGEEESDLMTDLDVLYRTDNMEPLSTVSGKYRVVQPASVLDFFRALVEKSGYAMETAGTFAGGRRLWAMCRANLDAEIVPGDPIGGYVLLATSYDGSMSTIAKFTTIRVICQNSLTAALRNRAGTGSANISIPHHSTFDPDRVSLALAGVADQFEQFSGIAKALSRVQMNQARFDDFLTKFVAKATPEEESTDELIKLRSTRTYRSIADLYAGAAVGAEMKGVSGTAWGALNAITEHFDYHVQARSDSNRVLSSWMGSGDRAKSNALQMLAREI